MPTVNRSFRRGRSFSTAIRRKSSWDQGIGQTGAQGEISASSENLVTTGSLLTLDGLTQVRLRGYFLAYLTSATAANDGYGCAFGIGYVTENAFDAGASAVPSPDGDANWDGWLYHQFFGIRAPAPIASGAAADTDLVAPVTSAIRFEIDSKAMRKTKAGDVLFGALRAVEVGTAVLRWEVNTRVLDKLA